MDWVFLLDEMKCCASRRTRTEPRHLGQELDQAFDFGTGDSLGHEIGIERMANRE